MIVVSDTSPFNDLVLIQHAEVLPSLFGRVIAAERGLLDLVSALAALRQTTFRVSDQVLDDLLRRDADRRRRLLSDSDSGDPK
jgi:predicted nucleic acid-binding protein